MTPRGLPALGVLTDALPAEVVRPQGRRPWRAVRRGAGWLLLSGWIVLPLLPALGLGISVLLGVGL